MTKKDYIIIAKTIKPRLAPFLEAGSELATYSVLRGLIDDLCEVFLNDNINFDRDRFLIACGYSK
jgi:hypothetical protein